MGFAQAARLRHVGALGRDTALASSMADTELAIVGALVAIGHRALLAASVRLAEPPRADAAVATLDVADALEWTGLERDVTAAAVQNDIAGRLADEFAVQHVVGLHAHGGAEGLAAAETRRWMGVVDVGTRTSCSSCARGSTTRTRSSSTDTGTTGSTGTRTTTTTTRQQRTEGRTAHALEDLVGLARDLVHTR